MEIKKLIDEWYYNELDPAVTIGEISRIKLAKKITEYLNSQNKAQSQENKIT